MDNIARHRRWLRMGGALLLSAALGYALAQLTGPLPRPGATKLAPAPAAKPADNLQIPDAYLSTMGIALETVSVGDLRTEIQAPGAVLAAPNGQAVITARAPGTLVSLKKRLGDRVRAGEVMALVESLDAAAMAADRSTALARVELARSNLKREQGLFDQKVTPRQDLEAAEAQLAAAEAECARSTAAAAAAGVTADGRKLAIVSPIAGQITVANVELGAYVEPRHELFRVADSRFVLIEAAVPATDARRVSSGDVARVTTGSGEQLRAAVVSVTPTLSEQTRSATVTLSLLPGQRAPAPGEFVQTRIAPKGSDRTSLVVTEAAVQYIGGRDVVFLRTGTSFKSVPVIVGVRTGGRASILSGLHAGETIAAKNAFLLKAELSKGAEGDE